MWCRNVRWWSSSLFYHLPFTPIFYQLSSTNILFLNQVGEKSPYRYTLYIRPFLPNFHSSRVSLALSILYKIGNGWEWVGLFAPFSTEHQISLISFYIYHNASHSSNCPKANSIATFWCASGKSVFLTGCLPMSLHYHWMPPTCWRLSANGYPCW